MREASEKKNYGYGKRPLWQWVALYLGIATIVYGLTYYFIATKKGGYTANQPGKYQSPTITQALPSPAMDQKQNTVTLTQNGWSPATLTIKAGQTVTWINKSGQIATINSNPHPIHTGYPPLNLGSFPDSGSLSLIFPKAGTYGYHNHLNPGQNAIIIVQ